MLRLDHVVLCGVLCALTVLAGCGGEEEEQENAAVSTASTSTSATTSEATVPTEEPDAPAPGGKEGQGEEPPLSEREVIAAVLTNEGDPEAACGELVTGELVRMAYGDRRGCLAARKPAALADSIEFERLVQTGTAGTARVIPSGGPYDGIEVQVDFESADGFGPPWRVTALEADVPAGP